MTTAVVKLLKTDWVGLYGGSSQEERAEKIRAWVKAGEYEEVAAIKADGEGERAAEDMFDLTNNPFRQDEREMVYGRRRSISVGDIVSVDGVDYFCDIFGWGVLRPDPCLP